MRACATTALACITKDINIHFPTQIWRKSNVTQPDEIPQINV